MKWGEVGLINEFDSSVKMTSDHVVVVYRMYTQDVT